MIDKRMIDIATKLLENSQKGGIKWSDNQLTPDKFSVDFPSYSVSIFKGRDLQRRQNCGLLITNDIGNEVESLWAHEGDEQYHVLAELFELARRTALKPDAVLDDLLARLSADE